MPKTISNPCPRCGTERIVIKVWEETITTLAGPSVVRRTQTVCPDQECQKALEAHLVILEEKREALRQAAATRKEQRQPKKKESKPQDK